jgi:hypothetical protein
MADVTAIRAALALRAETVPGLRGYATMPDTPMVPCETFAPAPGVFLDDVTMDGAENLTLVATVLVAKSSAPEPAQDALDAYLSGGASDIVDALDAGAGTWWDFVDAGPARGYGQYTFATGDAAQSYLGFEVPVMVGVS